MNIALILPAEAAAGWDSEDQWFYRARDPGGTGYYHDSGGGTEL